ncbi:protein phosphatase 2C domain-containing protein, partial [Streptomyces sp. URMC 125]|uniref:protein phosphatase 2C domain-containing protein n=1 Tax=Streptomyces sp. URMC 125 TaxID=3423419 RepID=UPI003F1A21F7
PPAASAVRPETAPASPAPGPPAAEPFALPAADPAGLPHLPSDTALDGARYGPFTLRAVSTRGDGARRRGEPRREALLTARFGDGDEALVLVALAAGTGTGTAAHRAARELCHHIGASVGRSHARLSEDIREARRGALKSGLHRLTGRAYGRLRADAGARGAEAGASTAAVRCLLLPVDPRCRIRVFFGVGEGGLFRLRDGAWQDIEPGGHGTRAREAAAAPGAEASGAAGGDGGTTAAGPSPMPGPFRFRASLARPGDTLLLCGEGLAEPVLGAEGFADRLAGRWSGARPPGPAGFLADVRPDAGEHEEDRTAAAVWEH